MVFENKTCKKVFALELSVLMLVGFVPFVDIAPDTAFGCDFNMERKC